MEAALRLLEEMKEQQPTLLNIQVYNSAIRVCAEAQNPDKAFQLFDEAVGRGSSATAAGAAVEPDFVTFGCLMTASERAGDLDLVAMVFRRMKEYDMAPNEIIYGAAISCCRKNAEVGNFFFL